MGHIFSVYFIKNVINLKHKDKQMKNVFLHHKYIRAFRIDGV